MLNTGCTLPGVFSFTALGPIISSTVYFKFFQSSFLLGLLVALVVAGIMGVSVDEVAESAWRNSVDMFFAHGG
jgi:hypothetical protein